GGNSLIELLVFGRLVGRAAVTYSDGLEAQERAQDAIAEARAEIDDRLASEGTENDWALQRQDRNLLTAHATSVRDQARLQEGRDKLPNIEERIGNVGIHPDIAGFADLSHAFDLRSSVLAARATIECALERRETRGCHNRSDYPEQDPALQVNLVWSPSAGV